MSFNIPSLPVIPGITDGAQQGGFAAPAAGVTDAVVVAGGVNLAPAVQQNIVDQAAAQAGASAAPPAEAPTKKTRAKSTRTASATNTAAGGSVQAAKFEIPAELALRVEALNAQDPNDARLLLLRALQSTEVAMATVDEVLGHAIGAAANFIGTQTEPSAGARQLYGNVMLALGSLFQTRLLPAPASMQRNLLLLALKTNALETNLAKVTDELLALQSARQHTGMTQQFQHAATATALAPAAAPMTASPVFMQQAPQPQVQQHNPLQAQAPYGGQLPPQPHQMQPAAMPQQQVHQAAYQPTLAEWQAMQAQAMQAQQHAYQPQPGTAHAYPPGFTAPFPNA